MVSITLYLLVSVGGAHSKAQVIERFKSAQDCELARAQLPMPHGFVAADATRFSRCVEARVAR